MPVAHSATARSTTQPLADDPAGGESCRPADFTRVDLLRVAEPDDEDAPARPAPRRVHQVPDLVPQGAHRKQLGDGIITVLVDARDQFQRRLRLGQQRHQQHIAGQRALARSVKHELSSVGPHRLLVPASSHVRYRRPLGSHRHEAYRATWNGKR
jgi:hypothetical protein